MLKELKPSYDELTFDIIFIPKGSAKKIHVENLEFGCTYSFENVRDAIEKANPFNVYDAHGGGSSRAKRFKRTVKIWNGAMIKQGIDGVTYVPRTPPPERVYYPPFRSNLSGYKVIYRSRERDSYVYRDNGHSRWQDLYNRAKEEDAAEREYYERQRASRAERRSSAQTEAERKWHEKIDKIFREGTLTYHIRKAKVAK